VARTRRKKKIGKEKGNTILETKKHLSRGAGGRRMAKMGKRETAISSGQSRQRLGESGSGGPHYLRYERKKRGSGSLSKKREMHGVRILKQNGEGGKREGNLGATGVIGKDW